MQTLFDGELHLQYGFVWLGPMDDEMPELLSTRQGQDNGLLGAVVPGWLSFVTGLNSGEMPFRVTWHEAAPELLEESWADVVELSYQPPAQELLLSSFDSGFPIELPSAEPLRARYSVRGADDGNALESRFDEPPAEWCCLDLWAAPPAQEVIHRAGSQHGQYWHSIAREADRPGEQNVATQPAKRTPPMPVAKRASSASQPIRAGRMGVQQIRAFSKTKPKHPRDGQQS